MLHLKRTHKIRAETGSVSAFERNVQSSFRVSARVLLACGKFQSAGNGAIPLDSLSFLVFISISPPKSSAFNEFQARDLRAAQGCFGLLRLRCGTGSAGRCSTRCCPTGGFGASHGPRTSLGTRRRGGGCRRQLGVGSESEVSFLG